VQFLLPDAMLAWYMLSLYVRLFVRPFGVLRRLFNLASHRQPKFLTQFGIA